MDSLGKLLIGTGLAIAALGGLFLLGSRISWLRIGRLPGDIAVEREGFGFYFPLTTMLLLSAAATFIVWLIGRFRG